MPDSRRGWGCSAVVGWPVAHLTAVAPAILAHAGQVLQDAGTQFIHDLLQFRLEFRRIQFLGSPGPPGMPEFLSLVTKVHPDMADAAEPLILLWRHGVIARYGSL